MQLFVIGLVLLTGSFIYTIHRSITYPFLLLPLALSMASLFGKFPFEAAIWIPFQVSKTELDIDRWRYYLRQCGDLSYVVWADWGAQVHFLYCSGLAIMLALLLGKYVPAPSNWLAFRICLFVAIATLIAGFLHNVRLMITLGEHKNCSAIIRQVME